MKNTWIDKTSAKPAENKRTAERRPIALPARLTWKDQRGTMRFASVVTRNVSEFGVYVECRRPSRFRCTASSSSNSSTKEPQTDQLPVSLEAAGSFRRSIGCRPVAIGSPPGARAAPDGRSEAAPSGAHPGAGVGLASALFRRTSRAPASSDRTARPFRRAGPRFHRPAGGSPGESRRRTTPRVPRPSPPAARERTAIRTAWLRRSSSSLRCDRLEACGPKCVRNSVPGSQASMRRRLSRHCSRSMSGGGVGGIR